MSAFPFILIAFCAISGMGLGFILDWWDRREERNSK